MSTTYSFFATCPKGLESLLLNEIDSFGAVSVKETVGGVHFSGDIEIGYRACLWSRLANRILLPVLQADCSGVDNYYQQVKSIDWDKHIKSTGSLAIDFSGSLPGIKHTHFGALKAKDAIVDFFNENYGCRPDIDTDKPDVRINIRAAKGKVTVSIDMSGDSLHKRGYRINGGKAPLKENLAAAILLRADWPSIAARGGALLDPMCGSGTLLIEGAMMFANMAPSLLRNYWGFDGWLGHKVNIWLNLIAEAREARNLAMTRQWPEIRGYDASVQAIEYAEANIEQVGLVGKVRVLRKELARFVKPTHSEIATGLIICNPPYGERLGEESSLLLLYRHLGQRFKEEFLGWQAGVFTGNPDLGKQMGLRSSKQYQFFNGAIPSKLLKFEIEENYFVHTAPASVEGIQVDSSGAVTKELSDGATMFANRLRKNLKQLKKWLKQNDISCYRLYDADMPEYAVAIDYYEGWVHVAEYAPPAKVDPKAAEQRLHDVLSAIPEALDVSPKHVVLKQRRRQKGANQYEKQQQIGNFFEVREGQAKLLVNMHDYLDTGLFLDHRPVRLKIAELAKGQRFLNLFCYTATASVHAALAGATLTDSVDLSQTYLEWAKKNIALNGLAETSNRFIRADVRDWLVETSNRYDLILLDPPTFSNSKKMDGVLDIQRDHVDLIKGAMNLLTKNGLLIFSNNQRKFDLAIEELSDYQVDNKTDWSFDRDFQRSKKIHQCWFIRHKEVS